MVAAVSFFIEDVEFELTSQKIHGDWLECLAKSHDACIDDVNYILVSDQYLLKLNQNYLDHDTFTDIITFPYDPDEHKKLGGDIYISVERVKENAVEFNVSFEDELARVMAHGLLHLIGFEDKDETAQRKMRAAEDAALKLRK